ncbi:MAG: Phospholipase/carboxylesterase family protein, partial [uncultured Acetobacteraceae bacterium]
GGIGRAAAAAALRRVGAATRGAVARRGCGRGGPDRLGPCAGGGAAGRRLRGPGRALPLRHGALWAAVVLLAGPQPRATRGRGAGGGAAAPGVPRSGAVALVPARFGPRAGGLQPGRDDRAARRAPHGGAAGRDPRLFRRVAGPRVAARRDRRQPAAAGAAGAWRGGWRGARPRDSHGGGRVARRRRAGGSALPPWVGPQHRRHRLGRRPFGAAAGLRARSAGRM